MKIHQNEIETDQKRSNKLISHCYPSLDFPNRKLKSKPNLNLIKNIIFMISQFNQTRLFLRIRLSFKSEFQSLMVCLLVRTGFGNHGSADGTIFE